MRGTRGGTRLGALLVVTGVLASGLAERPPAAALASRTGGLLPRAPGAEAWSVLGQDDGCDIRGLIDSPAEGAEVPAAPLTISGWAADLASTEGTGIKAVRGSVDAPPDHGGRPLDVRYGIERPEVAELVGDERFVPSGFTVSWDASGVAPGPHVLYVQVLGACGWTAATRTVTVAASDQGSARITAASAGQANATPTPSPTAAATATPAPSSAPSTPPSPTPPAPPAAPSPSPTPAMAAPTNLTVAVNPFDGAVSLSWQVPAGAPTIRSYLVVSNEADGTQRPILEVPGSQTRVTIRGLNPRIGYSFSVLAIDSLGRRGAPSAPASSSGAPTTTPIPTPTIPPWCTPITMPNQPPYCPGAVPPGLLPGYGPPGYPPPPGYPGYGMLPASYPVPGQLQLTAVQTGPTTVQLSWVPVPGATSYNVLQGLNGAAPSLLAGVGGATSYLATLPPGGSVTYQVQALGPNGQEMGRSNLSQAFSYGVAGAGVGQVSTATSRIVALSPNPASLAQLPSGVQVQVQVRDASGAPVPNAPVLLQVTGAAMLQGATQQASDAGGNAAFTVRGTAPGQANIAAIVNGVTLPGLVYTFVP